jgi:hypothetical protein
MILATALPQIIARKASLQVFRLCSSDRSRIHAGFIGSLTQATAPCKMPLEQCITPSKKTIRTGQSRGTEVEIIFCHAHLSGLSLAPFTLASIGLLQGAKTSTDNHAGINLRLIDNQSQAQPRNVSN